MHLARWGATEAERVALGPADGLLPRVDERWVRAVDVAAPADLVWRWLCQLQVAPYSYDKLDNLGRRSPQVRDPALEAVQVGDRAIGFFTVEAVQRPEHLVLVARPRSGWLPPFAMAYAVHPRGPRSCRLVLLLDVAAPARLPRPAARAALGALCAGDLVMARRQLLNLRDLAEAEAKADAEREPAPQAPAPSSRSQ